MFTAFSKFQSAILFLPVMLPATQAGAADLQVAQPKANVGTIRAGSPLRQRFSFVNRGTEPVEILELRASCGCAKPSIEKRLYQPGEEGALFLEVHTLGQSSGPHTWNLFVSARQGTETFEIPLELQAEIVTEVSVQPAALSVFAENSVHHEIVVTDLRDHPLSIASLQSSSPKLKTTLANSTTDAGGHKTYKIQIEIASDYPEGRHEEIVNILTDDPAYRDLRVPVTIMKQSTKKLTVLPSQVDLIAAPKQEVPSKIVLIRSGADQAVIVESVEANDPAVTCHWAQGPGKMATVRINVDRSKISGSQLQTTVRVRVGQPFQETLTIPLTCTLE